MTGLRVKGDPIPAPPQAGEGQLRLVTSLRSTGLLGGLRPATTMYVDAELEKAAPAGAVAPADPGTS
ncbi:hypothetical protein [Aeromicrobium sp. UC242_57]|uniref:hypothetical protein n=1 Tax=Aeromicrobium sp. UC242_57 TaxID=3374624 RepID=UPI0037A5FC64